MRPAPRARDAKSATSRGIETLFAGTSGFSYATWKGKFYPASLPGAKMLRHYAERLNGVELNGSFYRTPPEATLRKWADDVPPDFRFCMKANRGLTYSADTFDRVGLARIKNVALLDSLLTALNRPAAVEFRHESWFDDDTYRVLRDHGGALVITDEAKWPRAPLVDLGSVAYFRLRRGYTNASLQPWVDDVRSAVATHEQVHVYFKHDSGSPALARRLLRLAAREPVRR